MTEATPSLSEHWERNDEAPTTSARRPSCPVQPYTDAVKDPQKDSQTEVQIQVYDEESVPCRSDASDNKGSGSPRGAQDYV